MVLIGDIVVVHLKIVVVGETPAKEFIQHILLEDVAVHFLLAHDPVHA